MRITLWGTRGSRGGGSETYRYGSHTSCVEVAGSDGTTLVLDAGSGLRRLGDAATGSWDRVDLLLSHLHVDHVEGLAAFLPGLDADVEVSVRGPATATSHFSTRIARYLSPPLFPVRLRDLGHVHLADATSEPFRIGCFTVRAEFVVHAGPTVGFRLDDDAGPSLAYLPDHEPALGAERFPMHPTWTSGFALADGVDVLIHDAQLTAAEYAVRRGTGHCAIDDALVFAELSGVRRLVTFHHDHDDAELDRIHHDARHAHPWSFELVPGRAGATLEVA